MTTLATPRASTPEAALATARHAPERLAGLTAVRGIAVLAVVVFHVTESDWRWLPGGWAGVDVFFVLSGYLVERVLVQSRGEHPIRRFYLRRWARLAPALALVLVAAVLVAATAASHAAWAPSSRVAVIRSSPVRDYLTAAVQTVVGYRNIAMAGGQVGAPALGHLWSLSIEAQAYLVWPVLFFAARTRPARVAMLTAATAISVLVPLSSYHGVSDRAGIYFATTTHVVSLALGALCYELELAERVRGRWRDGLLLVAGCGVLAIFCWLGEGTLKYQSGSAITALAGCGLLVASGGTGARLGRPWARPLVWLGDRSYGLYLWHVPLLAWVAFEPGWTRVVAVAAAVGLADLSFRYVEVPVIEWARRREHR